MKGVKWKISKKFIGYLSVVLSVLFSSLFFIGSSASAVVADVNISKISYCFALSTPLASGCNNGDFNLPFNLVPATDYRDPTYRIRVNATVLGFEKVRSVSGSVSLSVDYPNDGSVAGFSMCGIAQGLFINQTVPCDDEFYGSIYFGGVDQIFNVSSSTVTGYQKANGHIVATVSLNISQSFSSPVELAYLNAYYGNFIAPSVGSANSFFYASSVASSALNSTISVGNIAFNLDIEGEDYTEQLNQIQGSLDDIGSKLDEQNQRENEGINNIENQSDPDTGDDSTGTNIVGYISSFVSAVLAISPTNCNIDIDTGYLDVGNVNLCTGGLPTILPLITSAVAIGIFIPYAYVMIRRILSEIRSFTNG